MTGPFTIVSPLKEADVKGKGVKQVSRLRNGSKLAALVYRDKTAVAERKTTSLVPIKTKMASFDAHYSHSSSVVRAGNWSHFVVVERAVMIAVAIAVRFAANAEK